MSANGLSFSRSVSRIGREAPSAVLSIPATLHRFDGGSGPYTMTNAVCLRPGDLTPAQLAAREYRVFVDGVEQSIYAEALTATWGDGSVRSVATHFVHTWAGSKTAEIRIGEVRQTSDIAKQTINGAPDAWLLPSNAQYLCDAYPLRRFDRVIPQSQWPSGEPWATFKSWMEGAGGRGFTYLWARAQILTDYWEVGSSAYYDFFRAFYSWFCANPSMPELVHRGCKIAHSYVSDLGKPNGWFLQEQHACGILDTLVHYLLTGYEDSKTAAEEMLIARTGSSFTAANQATVDHIFNHGRIGYAYGMAIIICHILGRPNNSFDAAAGTDWDEKAASWVSAFITQQTAAASLTEQALPYPWKNGVVGCNNWRDVLDERAWVGEQIWQVGQRTLMVKAYRGEISTSSPAGTQAHIMDHVEYYINDGYSAAEQSYGRWDQRAWGGTWTVGGSDSDLSGFTLVELGHAIRTVGGTPYTTQAIALVQGMVDQSWWETNPPTNGSKQTIEKLMGFQDLVAALQGS